MKETPNTFIKKRLQYHLDNLNELFDKDELAYLSSHCKNELQIRDRIAWKLHQEITKEYGDLYVVRREWAPDGLGKQRVDLAILKMDANNDKVVNVLALIEFKAQSIARREKWYQDEFIRDVTKMREFKQNIKVCNNAYLYFVFLETGQNRKTEKYKSVLAFSLYQTSKCVYCKNEQDKEYLNTIKSFWKDFEGLGEEITIHDPIAKDIGEAFGYTQYVSPLLIGPLVFKKKK